jgi:hypothetical protein
LKKSDSMEPTWSPETNEVKIIPEVKRALEELSVNGFFR